MASPRSRRRDESDTGWMDLAACRGATSLWFPEAEYPKDTAEPIRQCWSECPVRLQCLDYALRHNERFGIWGGLSSADRETIRRALARRGELAETAVRFE